MSGGENTATWKEEISRDRERDLLKFTTFFTAALLYKTIICIIACTFIRVIHNDFNNHSFFRMVVYVKEKIESNDR